MASGFMKFMKEWRSKTAERRKLTDAEVRAQCDPIWRNMPADERKRYKTAKPNDVVVKPISHSTSINTICDILRRAKNTNCLEDVSVTFVAFNHFDHRLPLPPRAKGDSNLAQVKDNILDYFHQSKDVVLFIRSDLIEVVRSCLEYLKLKDFKLHNIESLQLVLMKAKLEQAGVRHEINALNQSNFITDVFEYTANIACEYHEKKDLGNYCAKSLVTRWCLEMSKSLEDCLTND